MPNQPTILVKKADGTQVRMTMSEFGIYKKTIKQKNNKTTIGDDESVKEIGEKMENPTPDPISPTPKDNKNLPAVEGTTELAVDAPVKEIFVDEAKYVRKYENDTKLRNGQTTENKKIIRLSALGGNDSFTKKDAEEVEKFIDVPMLPDKRDEVLDSILPKLSFSVAPELHSRLKSLIVSRLKDVRSAEQVGEYAVREKAKGGLGLSEEQANELVEAITEETNTKKPEIKKAIKQTDSIVTNPVDAKQGINNRATATARVPMHDIVAPVKPIVEQQDTVSPIDELNNFSLLDFRRLSAKPASAVEILLEKINNLHQDSYEQFSLGLKAWYNSPLYRQYQNVIRRAVEENKKIADILPAVSREELNKAEFAALARGLENLNV